LAQQADMLGNWLQSTWYFLFPNKICIEQHCSAFILYLFLDRFSSSKSPHTFVWPNEFLHL